MGYYAEFFAIWFGIIACTPVLGYMMNRGIVQKAIKAPIPLPHRAIRTKVFM